MSFAFFFLGCIGTMVICHEIVLAKAARSSATQPTDTPIGWKPRPFPEINPSKGEWLRGYCDAFATAAAYFGMPSTEEFHRASADIAEGLWDIQINYPNGREFKVDCLAGEFSFEKRKQIGDAINVLLVAPVEKQP